MKPRLMPSMCGTLRRTPKFTPEASSIMLLGPGVTEVTKAKSTKASSRSRLMGGDSCCSEPASLCIRRPGVAIQRAEQSTEQFAGEGENG